MSFGFFKQTKSKVIISYILLFLLSLIAVIFIYKQITRLAVDDEGISQANQKLFLIGNTITELYEAESLSNVFLQTGSNSSFTKYIGVIKQVNVNIDSLRGLTTLSTQQLRLDSVSMLLAEKTRNLQALITARKLLEPGEFYTKAIASIESGRDSIPEPPTVRQRTVTIRDSTYVKNEKKRKGIAGWFTSKIRQDSALQITTSHRLITDTLEESSLLQSTDTVINILKSVWEDVQIRQKNIARQMNRAEYNIITQSSHITDQLRRILGEYEKEELNHSFRKIGKREKVVNTTTYTIAWIAVAAFLSILLFAFFILRDISRSQRYRRKLENASQYADQLLKSREKMILTVTHDIKSPLSSVIGYIELLDNTPVNERQRYFLKNMKGSAEHILKLIANLLDLSRLENNKMTIEEVVFNPAQLFREITDNFMPLAAAKQLELTGEYSEDLDADHKGDALRIRQVITNILSNAVKYTTRGSVRFSAVSSATSEHIILTIRDTGSGMTPEEQQLIFQEFTRLSSHSSTEGTGLGLTITLKLLQLLGGEIRLDSTPGQGSCFTILLPIQKAPAQEAGHKPQASSKVAATPMPRLKILLVDDDPLQLEVTATFLENNGIHPTSTTQPEKVTGILMSENYDMVISDIQMPGMNGFELVKQIRQLPASRERALPVIALSANSGKKEADYHQAGFTAYLPKPFSSAQLLRLICQHTGYALPEKTGFPSPAGISADLSHTEGYTLKNILEFADDDPETMQKIIRSFIAETRKHLELLRQYAQVPSCEPTAKLAHKMLPLMRQLETTAIVRPLEKLEHQDKTPLTAEEVKSLTGEVIRETETLIGKLANQSIE